MTSHVRKIFNSRENNLNTHLLLLQIVFQTYDCIIFICVLFCILQTLACDRSVMSQRLFCKIMKVFYGLSYWNQFAFLSCILCVSINSCHFFIFSCFILKILIVSAIRLLLYTQIAFLSNDRRGENCRGARYGERET